MPAVDLKTYCSLPFSGFDSRVGHVCCWTASVDQYNRFSDFSQCVNSDIVKKLQQDLITGIKNPLCKTCWGYEDVGVTSLRQTYLQNKTEPEINLEISNQLLKYLVLDSGNVCNLSCRTCWPDSSSSLIKEFQVKAQKNLKIYHSQGKIRHVNLELLKKQNFNSIETISVLGGEPFQNLDHLDLLEHIIALGRSGQCKLYYSTNGTVPMNNRFKEIFSKFHTVDLSLSIDAVGSQFEYIRTNGQWAVTEQNINHMIELSKEHPNIVLSGHPTISCLNVLYLEPLFDWYSKNNLHWIPGFCANPREYSFDIFNPTQRQFIIEELKKSKFDTSVVIKQLQQTAFNSASLKLFFQQTEFTKEYKKLDAVDFLPELMNLLK